MFLAFSVFCLYFALYLKNGKGMAPRNIETPKLMKDELVGREKPVEAVKEKEEYEMNIVWKNVILLSYVHLAGFYGMFLFFFKLRWASFWYVWTLGVGAQVGISAGSHRYFSHGAFKATRPLKMFLMLLQTMCCQNCIHTWVRDHRMHHQYTDTDADPHSAARGFFFSHCGWLMVKKHPEILSKGKSVYMDDIEADDVIMFQKKYFIPLTTFLCFILPTLIPWYFWDELLINAWHMTFLRYAYSLNSTWSVNSLSHRDGIRPFVTDTLATDSLVVDALTFGDGWHNFHHAFPKDYRYSEYRLVKLNVSTLFIDLMSKFGWAYDLHTTPIDIVLRKMLKTGDGSYPLKSETLQGNIVSLY